MDKVKQVTVGLHGDKVPHVIQGTNLAVQRVGSWLEVIEPGTGMKFMAPSENVSYVYIDHE